MEDAMERGSQPVQERRAVIDESRAIIEEIRQSLAHTLLMLQRLVGEDLESRPASDLTERLEHSVVLQDDSALDSCPICYDEFVGGDACARTPCGHAFHRTCIQRWLHRSATCPVCRRVLS